MAACYVENRDVVVRCSCNGQQRGKYEVVEIEGDSFPEEKGVRGKTISTLIGRAATHSAGAPSGSAAAARLFRALERAN